MEEALKKWKQLGGEEFDKILSGGAVKLLDSEWLIQLADSGGVLGPRQALPSEAFIEFQEVKALCLRPPKFPWRSAAFLPIVSNSHCWLQQNHPDPHGHNLSKISKALKDLKARVKQDKITVFMDWSSIFQCCRDEQGNPQPKTYRWLNEKDRFGGPVGRKPLSLIHI